jgi:flagellar basal body P-ring protein FlgI
MKPPTSYLWTSGLLLAAIIGCQQLNWRSQSPDKEQEAAETDEEFETSVETPFIGEYTTIAGLNMITLQGVGLVTGLDGTGSDPPPSTLRTALLEDMRKRGVAKPNEILRSPNTALVIVRAYLPPLVRKGDTFDVEVRLPGNTDATSLNGGWLMETYLAEQAVVPGRGVLEGHIFAKAKGPILISTGEGDKESLAGVMRRGRVLGGGVSMKERDMALFLRNDFRSVRNAKRISDRIGRRFYHYDKHGIKESLAEAKTDQKVQLQIHPRYRENFPRFLQVVRNIAFRESEVAQRVRMQQLREQLLTPQTAEKAAIKLESLGIEAVPVLKEGLKSPSLEVRFHAAMALAYLEDASGLKVLAEAAAEEPAFRVFALAALTAVDDAEGHVLLRDLMDRPSAETRYGAFRALTTLDTHDPFVRGEELGEQFLLHVLETAGDPMIHVTHRRKAEIVLFGANQEFHTPLVIRAGRNILVTAQPGSNTITVSRYEIGRSEERRIVSPRVADVIRAAAELGASYPDVAGMLVQAEKQHNLPGRIEIDALPRAGRLYVRPEGQNGFSTQSKARVGNTNMVPNLFDPADGDEEPPANEPADDFDSAATPSAETAKGENADSENAPGTATSVDLRAPSPAEEAPPDQADTGRRFDLRRLFKVPSQREPDVE